ncbi:MAG: hypothetical protein COA32_05800 [Fluviicola sp.]|nr:MAG: hypothetical protein COA32_05800 [Fluviicola sp.]
MARLSKRQRKNIEKPFKLSVLDHQEIRENSYDWSSTNLKPLKDRIRKHYKKEQNGLCSYCKLPFRDVIQVEHMVPKGDLYGRSEFSFLPTNLSVACTSCNTKKSINNDMIPWDRTDYPKAGLFFKIIHPHYDPYLMHIEIVDKSRYTPKTVKGYNTIKRCKLYESNITEQLVKYMKYEDDPLIQGVLRIRELQGDLSNIKNKIDRFFSLLF